MAAFCRIHSGYLAGRCPHCKELASRKSPAPAVDYGQPGKRCSRCRQDYQKPTGMFCEVDDVPHTTPEECITYLGERLEDVLRTLERHNF